MSEQQDLTNLSEHDAPEQQERGTTEELSQPEGSTDTSPVDHPAADTLLEEDNFDQIFEERQHREPNPEVRDALKALQDTHVREAIDEAD